LMQPMWMGAQPAEAVQHRNAGFVRPMLRRVRIGPGIAYAAAAPPFAIPPVFLNAASALTGPVLRLATAVHGPVEMAGRRGGALPLAEPIWSSTYVPLHVPQAVITLVECRLRAGARITSVPSRHDVPPRLRPASTACHWVNEAPQVARAVFSTHQPLLRTALRIPLAVPQHIAAGSSPVSGPPALIWRLQLHLPTRRLPVIRPQFNSPGRDYPSQPLKPAAVLPVEIPRESYWQSIPARRRGLILSAPLVLVMLALAARLITLAPVGNAREAVFARIHERAAIDLQDDFRTGLSQWTGVSGWAETWSYDPTGFARPGRRRCSPIPCP
jgi:hypothetical protein